MSRSKKPQDTPQVTPGVTPADTPQGAPRGSPSFCIPRAAIDALLKAQASALQVCAYLVLARFTDGTGIYSPASVKAISVRTGTGKKLVEKALETLSTIYAGATPIVIDRAAWIKRQPDQVLPDGPTERGQVRYVLPDLGEPPESRVWIGASLVDGIGTFKRPLFGLKNAGSEAARMLLALYAINDMEAWGGADPRLGPWQRYEPDEAERDGINLNRGARLIRAKRQGPVGNGEFFRRVWQPSKGEWWGAHDAAGDPCWRALEALESMGLIYEMVTVLNRNPKPAKFAGGEAYGEIRDDAEPLYELDCRSRHGYKPVDEEGLAGLTAKTAGQFNRPVTAQGEFVRDGDETVYVGSGSFDGTYAALVPVGSGAMVVGIYRPRFRIANGKNAGVRDTWSRIREGNRSAFEFINAFRAANKLPPLLPPWDRAGRQPATPEPDVPPPPRGMVPTLVHDVRQAPQDGIEDDEDEDAQGTTDAADDWKW
jgi:hypothetical protein